MYFEHFTTYSFTSVDFLVSLLLSELSLSSRFLLSRLSWKSKRLNQRNSMITSKNSPKNFIPE